MSKNEGRSEWKAESMLYQKACYIEITKETVVDTSVAEGSSGRERNYGFY